MPKQVYDSDMHQRAFELFYETRNWRKVATELGLAYQTPFKWAKDDFVCPFGCPYHNWDKIIKQKNEAMQQQLTLIGTGITNAREHDSVVHELLVDEEQNRMEAVAKLLKSDFERMSHWEIMYAKIFYDLTGVAVSGSDIMRAGEVVSLKELLQTGLHVTNLEGGIRALGTVQDQIDKLRARNGMSEASGGTLRPAAPKEKEEELTISDLRKMREMISNTPPEKLQGLKAVLDADDQMIEAVRSGESKSSSEALS